MSLATITTVLALSVMPAAVSAPDHPAGPEARTFAFVSHAGGAEQQRLRAFGDCLDVVAPNWYSMDPASGAIGPREPDADVVAGSRRFGYQLWPVINAQTGGKDAIVDPRIRARIAAGAAALAARYGYDGITLDIEGITPQQGSAYTRLVAAVSAGLHRDGRKLAVYAPRRTDAPPVDSAAGYDWGRLSRLADLLLVSGYNEHYAGGEPGPVATGPGFDDVVGYASSISRRRVAPILGAFGYAWPDSGERARARSASSRAVSRSGSRATEVCVARRPPPPARG
jgi:spore germination protein